MSFGKRLFLFDFDLVKITKAFEFFRDLFCLLGNCGHRDSGMKHSWGPSNTYDLTLGKDWSSSIMCYFEYDAYCFGS